MADEKQSDFSKEKFDVSRRCIKIKMKIKLADSFDHFISACIDFSNTKLSISRLSNERKKYS